MTDTRRILETSDSVLLIDWPSKDVADALVGAGYTVVVKGGPEPDNYAEHELRDGKVTVRHLGRPPVNVDLVYCHRPLDELPRIVETATQLGAEAIWWQTGRASDGAKDPKGCWAPESESRSARELVESAGLRYVADVYIVDVVRELGLSERG